MSDQSRSSHFQVLFESALQDYERQTGTVLAKHPLAEQLENCHTVESVTTVLQEQAQAFSEFRSGDGRIVTSLNRAVSVLHALSTSNALGEAAGLVFPPSKAIFAGFAILLSTVRDVGANYDALVDLLEMIEHFLNRLNIYTTIPQTEAMAEVIVKFMVEILSALALVTKQIKQKRPIKFIKKLFRENDVDAVLQRLDRLTQDEARTTAAQTLEVVYGLAQNMRVVIDDGKASIDTVRDSLELLQRIAGDLNRSKRDKLQQDVRNWLSPPDPWRNHNFACESRHAGTGTWFVEGDTFSEWKFSGPSSLLWIHGKPGAGKSVLTSAIIQEIDAIRKSGLASLAFFYCDFRDDQKKDRHGLLSSFLVQLCDQSDAYYDTLHKFYVEHSDGSRHPSDNALVRCLKDILKCPGQPPVYLIVDAIDECPRASTLPPPREKILMLVKELTDSQLPGLRICVTSRPEADITAILGALTFRTVSLHDESGQIEDINNYIRSVVTTGSGMRRWSAEAKQLVIDALTLKADGMFRWAYCQLEYLCDCVPGRIRHALSVLPDTLDETYERTLREIKEANWEFAHRLFQCLTVASRPLRVEELAELLAFDFEEGPIPQFHEDWRLEDPVEAVLSTCSSLLSVVKMDDSKVIQFSHSSVKEFLTSARLAKTSDAVSRRYHISITAAHTVAAMACLGFLLHLDENVSRDDLLRFPLADYAAQHWFDHARIKDVAQKVEDAAQTLFHPRKPHFAAWVWIYDLHRPSQRTDMRGERPSPPSGTPLHYVALCGLHTIVKFLAIELSQDVNAVGFQDDATPLHLASSAGHVDVTRALLEHGSDVTAQCETGATPLHEASSRGHAEVCRVLLEHGANAATQDEHGSTPLHLASLKGHVNAALILLDHGADVAAQDEDGSTPLHLASSWGHTEVALLLLERGADVTARDRQQESTPLRLALWWGHTEVASVLREHGADEEDNPPPLGVELGGWADVISAHSQFGPDPDAQDNAFWFPSEDLSLGEYHIMMQLMNPPEDWDGESDLV